MPDSVTAKELQRHRDVKNMKMTVTGADKKLKTKGHKGVKKLKMKTEGHRFVKKLKMKIEGDRGVKKMEMKTEFSWPLQLYTSLRSAW